jgi:hypothetical protein
MARPTKAEREAWRPGKDDIVHLPVIQPRDRISHSELGLFNMCEWRWYLDYVLGLRSRIDGIHFSFGTACHNAIQAMKAVDKSARVDADTAKEMFKVGFLDEVARLQGLGIDTTYTKKDGTVIDNVPPMLEAGIRIIDHIDDISDAVGNWDVMWIEKKIDQPIDRDGDPEPIRFKGYIDIAFRLKDKRGKTKLFICDIKTCMWGWSYDKKTDPHVLAQPYLYKHFVCKEFDLDPKEVKVAFILLKKTPTSDADVVELLEVSSGPKALESAIEYMQTRITKMRSGRLVKNRMSCEDAYGNCPYLGTDRCT